ncbi:MAG: diguanylate cyclase [Pseudomonadota bacterium]|nr:diguanylate cyclase [Pseudomonadota bacterium]
MRHYTANHFKYGFRAELPAEGTIMLQLRKSDRQSQEHLGMLLEDERTRTSKMVERSAAENRASVKKMMGTLQQRFSNTGDIPVDIEALIEEQVKLRTKELFRQANFDALTHLPNRHYFGQTLDHALEQAHNQKGEFSLLFLDLDGFKAINDNLGHQAGDELLQNVAARLISSVREGDVVGRRGGDEFVILLSELSDQQDVINICQRVIDEVSRPYRLGEKEANISTSIGVARYPMDGKTTSELLENSDAALYVSKESGRHTFRFYHDIVQTEAMALSESELNESIETGQIEICFEPQVELASGQVVGASTTVQLNHDSMPPSFLCDWLPTLNKTAWSSSVSNWVFDSALYYMQKWKSVRNEWVISVPVLEALWKQDNMITFLDERLDTYGVHKAQLQLEFSIAALQDDDKKLKQVLIDLAEAGYQITLTDVGAHPIDFNLLASLQINEVKLDKAWLQQSLQTQGGQAWLEALIQMAISLDISVIATGVESKEQARKLHNFGCVMGQGSVWSKPVEAERFNNHLMARHRLGA